MSVYEPQTRSEKRQPDPARATLCQPFCRNGAKTAVPLSEHGRQAVGTVAAAGYCRTGNPPRFCEACAALSVYSASSLKFR
jgi:hypothetical protein